MPLSDLQHAILSLLAQNRNAESFVPGATPLQQDGPRYSSDIDIFHVVVSRFHEVSTEAMRTRYFASAMVGRRTVSTARAAASPPMLSEALSTTSSPLPEPGNRTA